MKNMKWSKFFRFWFPAILYSGIIFCASSVPHVKTPLSEIRFDVVLHVLVYVPFGFLLARAISGTRDSISAGTLLRIVFLGSLLYGASDEFHQFLVPGRDAGLIDLIADTVGGVIGGYFFVLLFGYNHTK